MYTQGFTSIIAALMVAGCAIHPEPEDVTGVTTAGIVKQIRCEARDAARAIVLRVLDRMAANGDQRAQSLSSQFHADPELMSTFNPQLSFSRPGDLHVREVFEMINSTAIAYNFDLTMNEENNLNTDINFLGPWHPPLTLGIKGNANRMRQNQRTFTIADSLGYLLTTLNTPAYGAHYCDGHITVGPNYIYPIVGRIGIYNTVYTFFQLSFFDGLVAQQAKPGVSGPPAITDVLTFTTIVDLTAAPKIVFAPVKTGFKLTDAALGGTLRRKDIHQVTLALALDSKETAPLASLRGYIFSGERTSGGTGRRVVAGQGAAGSQTLVLNRVTASTTSRAEQIAVAMIDQFKSRELQLIPPPSP